MTEEKLVSKSTYVFILQEVTRTSWHRHFSLRCNICRTYLVYVCDKVPGPTCSMKVHGITEKYTYSRHDSQLPVEFYDDKIKFIAEISDCNEHFTK